LILAIETSCDDTCAAVLDGPRVLANTISSQAAAHAQFGGVVPEVASRHHLDLTAPVVEAALAEAGVTLDEIEAIAVTAGPGLIGALLVGVSTAKAIAAPRRLPLVPVDHLQGHVAANFLEPEPLEPPFLCLVASGGHTLLAGVREHAGYELLGQTLDDAAGEAFDKVARMLGLGYPGGPALEKLARDGDPDAFEMPVAMSRNPGLDFSFSGLKTALVYLCRDLGHEAVEERRADLAASFQAAAVSQLVAKLKRALKAGEWRAVALGGGVAANGALREAVQALCERRGVRLKLVPRELCTDNAAMIGSAARYAEPLEYPAYLDYDAFPTGKKPADGPMLIYGATVDISARRPAV
jgi:N6-L-threonylcarbamoyladenine synthase